MSGGLSLLEAGLDEPERLALIDAGRRYTFAELAARVAPLVDRFAATLSPSAGATVEAAVLGHNQLPTLLAVYALLEGGWPFVLLHPRWTPRERRVILERSRPRLLASRDLEPAPVASSWTPRGIADDGRWLAVLYTSGTGGLPKGVVLSRRAFRAAARASAANLGWEAEDRWLLCLPIAHVGGLSILVRCLLARRTVVLDEAGRFAAGRIAELVCRHRITLLSLVPTMLHRMLALEPPWQPPAELRAILLGGAAASASLLEHAAERRLPVLTTYGLTEACSQVATQRYGTGNRGEQGVGEPMPELEVRIRGEADEGVVELRGASLLTGYLENGRLVDPFDADGWFSTGDLGRFDSGGRLHLLGRQSDLIVTGGENVHPTEVERELETHPGVARACVVGVEDEEWGERLVAALVAEGSDRVPDLELERHLGEHLARFKHPRELVWLERLPESAAGKVERRAVRAEVLAALARRPPL